MGTWISAFWMISPDGDDHNPGQTTRLIDRIRNWAREDGYLEEITHDDSHKQIWCSYTGECGWSAEDTIIDFLAELAASENVDVTFNCDPEHGDGSYTEHFGPSAERLYCNDAIGDLRTALTDFKSHRGGLSATHRDDLTTLIGQLTALAEEENEAKSADND